MIRVTSVLLALAALVASGPVARLHVHAYEGHDHPDHLHGPAAHSHEQIADHHQHHDELPADTGGPRIEACDPGAHVVPIVFTCVAPPVHDVSLADTTVAVVISPPAVVPRGVPITDVRAHSPPRLTDAPLRAPPVVHPA